MPPPEPRGTLHPFPFPFLTKEKKEFQTTTRLCGLALYPKLCCQLAPSGGGGCRQSPEHRAISPSPAWLHTAPVAVFSTTTCSGIFLSTQGFSHEVSFWPVFPESQPLSAYPSPCLAGCIPTFRELTTAFRSAWVSHKDLSSCPSPQWLATGWTLQAQPPANVLGGAGPSPGKAQTTMPIVRRLECRTSGGW